MKNQKDFNDDSMSLHIDDRFFQSDSLKVDQEKQQHFPIFNQQKQGISAMLNFSQNSNHSLIYPLQLEKSGSKSKKNGQIYSGSLISQNVDKRKAIQKQTKGQKPKKTNNLLQKKKENSKNYRQRKRNYFTTLQQQHQYYKKRTLQLEQKVKNLETQIADLKYDPQNHQKQGYEKQYNDALEMLRHKVQVEGMPNDQLVKIAAALRDKYGPAGSDRRKILNYYMCEYINNTMADYQKYIFQSALNKTGLFGQLRTRLDEKISQIWCLDELQRQKLQQTVLTQLKPLVISFATCCKNIYKNYVKLLQQAQSFQNVCSRAFGFIGIAQLSKFVIWFQKNKSRMQIRKLKQEWIRIFSGQDLCRTESQSMSSAFSDTKSTNR